MLFLYQYAAERATMRPIRKKEQPTANFVSVVLREVESERKDERESDRTVNQ